MLRSITFNYTGAVQTWTPPLGITRIKIECFGAQGGDMLVSPWTGKGGKGGYVYGEKILEGEEVFYLYVGGQGQGYNGSTNHSGGWNGGGTCYQGASGGGGASDVRTVSDDLNSRIIVAGGGGGSNDHTNGGDGGGLAGSPGQTNAGTAGGGGTQTSGGIGWINGSFGVGGGAANAYSDGGAGGSGWYGGAKGQGSDTAGGGGSSYYGILLNTGTIAGVQSGNGKIVITYEEDLNAYFLEKDNKFYMPLAKYFNVDTNEFTPITLTDVENELIEDNSTLNILNIIKSFTINSITYLPTEIINFNEYKLCVMSANNLYKIHANYTPSDIALSKTEIKIKNKYTPVSDELESTFLDIISPDKSQIDYFIDYGQDKIYKNCSILNTDVITNDFYLDFKLDDPDSLLQSVTLFGKDNNKYTKIKDFEINVYENFDNKESSNTFISFTNDYDEITINKLYKEELIYTINTLDKF